MSKQECEYRALSSKVLAVAVKGYVGDWACYIDAVRGNNHEKEWGDVKDNGNKLSRSIAEAIFPSWKNLSYRD